MKEALGTSEEFVDEAVAETSGESVTDTGLKVSADGQITLTDWAEQMVNSGLWRRSPHHQRKATRVAKRTRTPMRVGGENHWMVTSLTRVQLLQLPTTNYQLPTTNNQQQPQWQQQQQQHEQQLQLQLWVHVVCTAFGVQLVVLLSFLSDAYFLNLPGFLFFCTYPLGAKISPTADCNSSAGKSAKHARGSEQVALGNATGREVQGGECARCGTCNSPQNATCRTCQEDMGQRQRQVPGHRRKVPFTSKMHQKCTRRKPRNDQQRRRRKRSRGRRRLSKERRWQGWRKISSPT